MIEETPAALAEKIRQRVDSALTRRLENPACLTPASLIRILYPVIEKHLTAGLLLDEIASALQEEGYKVTKGHLVRHLGTIREERGLPPLRRGKRKKGGEDEGQGEAQSAAASPQLASQGASNSTQTVAATSVSSHAAPAMPQSGGGRPKPPPDNPEELEVDIAKRIVRMDGAAYPLVGWLRSNKDVVFRHPGIPEPALAAGDAGRRIVYWVTVDNYDIDPNPPPCSAPADMS